MWDDAAGGYRDPVSPWSCSHLSMCACLGSRCLYRSIRFYSKLLSGEWGISQGGALQQPYTLGTDFVEQNESSCAQRKGFALHTPPQHPYWCLGPLIQEAKAILSSTGPETSLAANVSWLDKIIFSTIRGTLKPRLRFPRRVGVVPLVLGSLAFQPQLQWGRPLQVVVMRLCCRKGMWAASPPVGTNIVRGIFGQGICCSAFTPSRQKPLRVSSGNVQHEPP